VYFDKILCGWNQVIKLCCGKNCTRIAANEQDLWLLIKKNNTSGLIKATEKDLCKTTGMGKMYMLCTGYLSPIFSNSSNFFLCINVRKKLSHVALTCWYLKLL